MKKSKNVYSSVNERLPRQIDKQNLEMSLKDEYEEIIDGKNKSKK